MDTVSYVNKIGKLINQSTKYNAKIDRVSITNIVIINHLNDLIKWAETVKDSNAFEGPITEDDINKLKNYINCLKKQINFYPDKVIDSDCIMTEVEENIIQE